MGTRADFYIGTDPKTMEWLGSHALDGHPEKVPESVIYAVDEADYRKCVAEKLATRRDWSGPDRGWPWPWEDSRLTDYAYTFAGGQFLVANWGNGWFAWKDATSDNFGDDEIVIPVVEPAAFPDMSAVQSIAWVDQHSGLITLSMQVRGGSR